MAMCESVTSVVLVCDTTRSCEGFAIVEDEPILMGIVRGVQRLVVPQDGMTDALSVCEALGHVSTSLGGGSRREGCRPIHQDVATLVEDTVLENGCARSDSDDGVWEPGLESFYQVR